jgi:hypothetical protein
MPRGLLNGVDVSNGVFLTHTLIHPQEDVSVGKEMNEKLCEENKMEEGSLRSRRKTYEYLSS